MSHTTALNLSQCAPTSLPKRNSLNLEDIARNGAPLLMTRRLRSGHWQLLKYRLNTGVHAMRKVFPSLDKAE